MLKSFSGVIIIISMILIIILYPLIQTLAHSQQQEQQQQSPLIPFIFPSTTMMKNQTNQIIQNKSMSSYNSSAYLKTSSTSYGSSSNSSTIAILNFYDNDIGQFINAKPILDKYGFKGTFFVVCNWATSKNPDRMNWTDITQLYREGHDIESHSMTHKVLDKLSASALDYEVGQSKQCLHDHLGIYPTVFSPPHSRGWNNATVINTISKYYDLSIGGFVNDVMFLHCYGWKQQKYLNQTDCRPYSDNGTLNYASRYDIKENAGAQGHSNDTLIFDRFANLVNREGLLNSNNAEPINSVLILGYHNLNNTQTTQRDAMDATLFDKEMKYLHDNGVRVITMSDLGYDENSNYLYVRNNTK
jgi:peptidoglycan/xylan/chitin deacetylase (PgdA/CDA1 family)